MDWRKDYTLHEFFEALVDVENCAATPLTKADLQEFLTFLKLHNGLDDTSWEGETLNYDKEIERVKEILKGELNDYEYFYWAWW